MGGSRLIVLTVLVISSIALPHANAGPSGADDANVVFAPETIQTMNFRLIGPFRGGRVTAVAGVRGQRDTFYMGSTGGGVWKTTDGGEIWRPVADKTLRSASIGAVAVAPSDPNVVYVGTGSACPRGNISPGDGVYRSTDAGVTWEHAGLPHAGQIGRIHVHPVDPDLVYVAALGHIFGPNGERGVYRSRDGGGTWERILFVSDRAGAVDLSMDPANPRILYAATWRVERKPWTLVSGGEGSGLFRSRDGGNKWEELTGDAKDAEGDEIGKGLPTGTIGRIGVAASGAQRGRVWALVEAEDGGLFRSDDYGKTFRLINDDRNFRQRAWYYTHVYADPKDAETVYIMNVAFWRSHDGGASFEYVRVPHGDNHDLWINPDNPDVLINGNDGGANVSYNGARSWSTQTNQPTAEFYRVSTDDAFPYRVYGCQQDNSCVSIASRTGGSSIGRQDWHVIGGGESGHIAIDPRDPKISYAGSYGGYITRYDGNTGQNRVITAWPQVAVGLPARDLKYRFQWNAPIRLSPHDPDVLYHASQFVHRSRDAGQSWRIISPDLTRDDESKQDYAGEPITRDNTGVEVYGTVFAFEESQHRRGLLWAGTDDGRVHVSRDDGGTWTEITPRRMPEWGQVNTLELSAHDPGRALLAVTRYRMDDFRPYVFRTNDYGKTWALLTDGTNGIPKNHFVRVVREDPDRKGLLYAGTEFGLYVSFDDGRHWQSLQQKMPVSPVTDLSVRQKDLVVATQGRSFWILDDLTPLHQMTREAAGADLHLFEPRAYAMFDGGGTRHGRGENPPRGVVIRYLLDEEIESPEASGGDEADPAGENAGEDGDGAAPELTLEILDGKGELLRRLSSTEPEYRAPNPWAQFFPEEESGRTLTTKKGMNRYVWDLRRHDAEVVDKAIIWGRPRGPRVPPGTYRARLSLGDETRERSFRVLADPRVDVTTGDLEAQHALATRIWEAIAETHGAVKRLRDVRSQANALAKRIEESGRGEGLIEQARAMAKRLTALEEKLHQYRATSSQDILNFPQGIDGQLTGLMGSVEGALAKPTGASVARFEELRAELDGYLEELREIIESDLTEFNAAVRETGVPAVFSAEGS